jgi:hypothetical protein
MIRSKIKTIGFWMTPIMITFVIGIFIPSFFNEPTKKDKIIFSIWAVVMLSLMIPQLWSSSKLLIINTIDKTISFTHFFTRQKTVYNFTDIDGYVDIIIEPARGRPFRVLYLVTDEKFIQKISSFIYSNIDEIEQGLKATKYLGKQDFSFLKQFRIFLGQKVLHK